MRRCQVGLRSCANALAGTRLRRYRRPRSMSKLESFASRPCWPIPASGRRISFLLAFLIVSSDWPVCPASETAAPHRMGTALTYARRYALFTLVGIAGEDDMDAPRLDAPTAPPKHGSERPSASGNGHIIRPTSALDRSKSALPVPQSVLDAERSNRLQEALIAEIEQLGSAEDATLWAQRSLPIKNIAHSGRRNRGRARLCRQAVRICPSPKRSASFSEG